MSNQVKNANERQIEAIFILIGMNRASVYERSTKFAPRLSEKQLLGCEA
jgi:hypothetical protein